MYSCTPDMYPRAPLLFQISEHAAVCLWTMTESSFSGEAGAGGSLHHAEYKARPQARPFHGQDA